MKMKKKNIKLWRMVLSIKLMKTWTMYMTMKRISMQLILMDKGDQ